MRIHFARLCHADSDDRLWRWWDGFDGQCFFEQLFEFVKLQQLVILLQLK